MPDFRPQYFRPVALLATVIMSMATGVAVAQLPTTQLGAVQPSGGQPGTTTRVTIFGKHLDDVDRLVFSHPGITALPLPEEKNAHEYKIVIADDVPVGVHDVRAVGRFGVSNPRAFVVERFRQRVALQDDAGAANRSREKAMSVEIGDVVNGRTAENRADFYRFAAKQGARLVLRCAGTRIDSRIDATLVLYDAAGKELMRVRDTESYDPVMAISVPADGEYFVEVYDFLYRGGDDYFYRLSLGRQPFVETVFPPAGQLGKVTTHTIYGYHLPGGVAIAESDGVAAPLEKTTVQIDLQHNGDTRDRRSFNTYVDSPASMLDGQPFVLSSPTGNANAISVGHAVAPIVLEAEPNNTADRAQQVSLPCDIAGQFQTVADEDWVTFTATAEERVWIDVISHRAGGRTDPALVVEELTTDSEGKQNAKRLSNMDDQQVYVNRVPNFEVRSRDPAFKFTTKKDATYRVMVRDVYNMTRGDARLTYRMVIGRGQPDFRLVAHGEPYRENNAGDLRLPSSVLRQGGTMAVTVRVFRRFGFDGDIHIAAEDLPVGVSCRGAVAAGGAEEAKLVFHVAEDASAVAAPIRIVGRAEVDGRTLERQARTAHLMFDTENPERLPPTSRLVEQFWVSVTDKGSAPATLHVDKDEVFETALGAQLALPFRITRRDNFKSDLRVTPEGLPRQLRLDQLRVSEDKQTFNLKMKINNFPAGTYTIDLLGRGNLAAPAGDGEKKKPTKFAVASDRLRIKVHATPVNLNVPYSEQTARQGETVSVRIPIERRFGFGGPVTLQLRAAKGISAENITVGVDTTDGVLALRVDASVEPGEYKCELLGQHVYGGLALAARNSFTLTVVPGDKSDAAVAGK